MRAHLPSKTENFELSNNLQFFVSVEKPQLKTARSKKVSEGSELKLKCKVTNRALPPPAISWYKDGALLTHNIDTKK